MSQLSLFLLGPPRLELDGEPVDVGRRKALALAAYLAVAGQGQARDSLAALLWPELDQSRARSALRRTLSALNRALGGAWLARRADRETVDLRRGDDLWVDVAAFRELLAQVREHGHPGTETCPACLDRLAEAAALYRDDFLAGFTLRDSPEFDDWQFFQAESLRRELAEGLERLVRGYCDRGELETAVDYARRWIRLDPLQEAAHRGLMQLYAWADQRPAALRQYHECARILEAELGVAPSDETTALYRRIQAGELSPQPSDTTGASPPETSPHPTPLRLPPSRGEGWGVGSPREVGSQREVGSRRGVGPAPAPPPAFLTDTSAPAPTSPAPFVAREDELARLRAFLDAALDGRGHAAFVAGEVGSGKTALAHEFARRAQEDVPELVVAFGNCNAPLGAGLGDPYLPFREMLGLLVGDVETGYAQGVITRENARRLWDLHPTALQALVETGPALVDSFVSRATLAARVAALAPPRAAWVERLEQILARRETEDAAPGLAQRDLFERYSQLLVTLARTQPVLLVMDDAQWADVASINLLFHLGRRLAGSRILLVVTYRPDDIAMGRPSTGSGLGPSAHSVSGFHPSAHSVSGLPPSTHSVSGLGPSAGSVSGLGPSARSVSGFHPSTHSVSGFHPSAGSGQGWERHPLEPVINELRRTYGDVWIHLDPAMGRHFVDALLDTRPNQLGDEFRAALAHQTEGHPLFTIELLRAMQERGDLVRDAGGRWIEGPALDWETLPARVEAVIEERVGRLEAGLRDILAVASVEGETFTAQVVARVQGLAERPLLGALSQELERRHHLVQSRGEVQVDHRFLSRYRFTHTMFQQYLYNTFSPGERRLLHGEIAAALEDLYQEEGEQVVVQLARHYAEAGRVEQAIDYLLRAGDRARQVYAYQEAGGFYEQALASLREQGAYERAARTLMKLGLTYHLDFDFPRARGAYQEGFDLWQRAGAALAAPPPPAPHPLRLLWFDPPTLDPTRATDNVSMELIDQLFSGLVRFNRELDVVPEMAERWEMYESGERWVFHLRGDARWSDGQPVTADDFVYAWRRLLDPVSGSGLSSYLFDIKGAGAYREGVLPDPDQLGVRALNPTTLLIELEGPTGYFPLLLTMLYPIPRHVVEAHGEAWTEPEHLVTNGPFRLGGWEPGHSMLLTRNPDYPCQVAGNVEQVALTLNVDSLAEGLAMYEADQLDLVMLWPETEANRARQRRVGEYFSGPALYSQYIGFNVGQPPFDDRRVRRALAMAVDKEKLANVTLAGHYFPATGGMVPPEMPGHSPGIGLPYDPEAARRLLAEAGYPEGRGFPETRGLVNQTLKKYGADEVSAQWRETLGVDVTWGAVEWADMLRRLEHELPALLLIGWSADFPDPDNALDMSTHSQWTGWHNPAYVRLLKQAKHVADHAERMRLYQQADRILVEDAAVVPILYSWSQFLFKPWVRQLSPSSMAWTLWKDVIIEPH